MKNSILISLSVTLFLITSVFNPAFAQTKNQTGNIGKYEIAVDLQELFSEGYPQKIMFKVNSIKDDQVKGAFRVGVNFLNYTNELYEVTLNDKDYEVTSDLETTGIGFRLGYEFQKEVRNCIVYYGADLLSSYSVANQRVSEEHGDSEGYMLSFIPFVGLKAFISKSVSVSLESGWRNSLSSHKYTSSTTNPDNKIKITTYSSKISIPYSLTLNYKF